MSVEEPDRDHEQDVLLLLVPGSYLPMSPPQQPVDPQQSGLLFDLFPYSYHLLHYISTGLNHVRL